MKIRMYEGDKYYSFDGVSFYTIEWDALPLFERVKNRNEVDYSVESFLTELFTEGEKRIRGCVPSEYYNFYIMLYLGMRLCCDEDVDVPIPEMVIDYLNHLQSKHKLLMRAYEERVI